MSHLCDIVCLYVLHQHNRDARYKFFLSFLFCLRIFENIYITAITLQAAVRVGRLGSGELRYCILLHFLERILAVYRI